MCVWVMCGKRGGGEGGRAVYFMMHIRVYRLGKCSASGDDAQFRRYIEPERQNNFNIYFRNSPPD